jgi:hypothetical protein
MTEFLIPQRPAAARERLARYDLSPNSAFTSPG